MIVKYSRKSDEEEIKDLLYKSFGEMVELEKAYEGIDKGRYLCAVIDGEIVAITDICLMMNLEDISLRGAVQSLSIEEKA